MTFWVEVLAGFLANVLAGMLLVLFYVIIQWFLQATDVTVSYGWRFEGTNCHPSFDIRNRSKSKTYLLANIAYEKRESVVGFDNKSIWGTELKPGSILHLEAAPVTNVSSPSECLAVEVTVRLQDGRTFWLKGQGPGQLDMGRIQRIAFWLRKRFEVGGVPLE